MLYSVGLAIIAITSVIITIGDSSIVKNSDNVMLEEEEIFPPKNGQEKEVVPSGIENTKDEIARPPIIRDMTAIREMIASGNWDRFTPPPIKNPDCHVEVQMVQKVPGRCIRLGVRQVPACQTQNWVAFDSDDCAS